MAEEWGRVGKKYRESCILFKPPILYLKQKDLTCRSEWLLVKKEDEVVREIEAIVDIVSRRIVFSRWSFAKGMIYNSGLSLGGR
jgi:hypothetical protein